MLMPLTVRGLTLKNRIMVSPMATYSAVDGVPQDFLLVHLGARALGGAAMVFVEMTSPTPEGRITPACTGLYNDAQSAAFKRIVDFVHTQSEREDRHAARPQRAEGLDAGGLGRHGRAAAGRQLAAAGRQRAGLRRTEPAARRDDARRHGHACATSSSPRRGARPRPASTGSNCTARTATCWPPSSAR